MYDTAVLLAPQLGITIPNDTNSATTPGLTNNTKTPASTQKPSNTHKPKQASPSIEELDLGTLVRSHVHAANREWFSRLAENMNRFLAEGEEANNNNENIETGSKIKAQTTSNYSDKKQGSSHVAQSNDGIKTGSRIKSGTRPSYNPNYRDNKQDSSNTARNQALINGVAPESDPGSRRSSHSPGRYIEANTADKKFAQFAFGDASHAYVAGADGLWNVSLAPLGGATAAPAGDGQKAATAVTPGTKVEFTQFGADKITLNGQKNVDSPIKQNITDLRLYGAPNADPSKPTDLFPFVTIKDADPTKPAESLQIFAAVDAAGTKFVTNKLTAAGGVDGTGQFYDASQKLNLANTYPDTTPINQPIVAITASNERDRFFVAVADGAQTDRKLYSRPADWEKTVRQAIINGMPAIKKNGAGGNLDGGAGGLEGARDKLIPDAVAPTPADDKEKFTQALITSVDNTIFLQGRNKDAANIHQEYSALAFRDAINLRKGGLLDRAFTTNNAAGTTVEILGEIGAVGGITGQADPAAVPPPDFNINAGNTTKGVVAAVIQVALGRGIRELVAATQDVSIDLNAPKPFASLDSRRMPDAKDATQINDLNIYVADQDGLARGICVADRSGTEIVTMDVAGPPNTFRVNPGKIVTTAMYDGIKLDDENALAKNFGKLEQVGIPCAVYSGADAYPASRAMISGDVDMLWDDQLQRLFVGFSDISLGDNAGYLTNGSGGACSIMVGKEKTDAIVHGAGVANALYFQPIIGPHFQSLLFQNYLSPGAADFGAKLPWAGTRPTANPTDYIVGFYQKHDPAKLATSVAADDLHASAKKLRVMHTSTGKDYIVFNGGVARQADLPSLNAKLYALPLIGAYDANLMSVPEAGLLAAAERAPGNNGADFYAKGLAGIKFAPVDAAAPNPAAGYTIGSVDPTPAAANKGTLTELHQAIQGDEGIAKILNAWGTGAGGNWTQKGQAQSQEIWKFMEKNQALVSGLATTALASCYVKADNDSDIPANNNDAGSRAFNLLNPGSYQQLKKNSVFERIEGDGLDHVTSAAVGVVAGNRFKYQAPADEVARHVLEARIQGAAGAHANGDAVWADVDQNHPALWADAHALGAAHNLEIANGKFAAGPLNANGDAGGIAAGVAGIEGSLGWAIKNIMDGGNNFHTTKLIPAIATMHADVTQQGVPYPAFDYVRVGADPQRLSYDTSANVLDSWVVGDSVYVALGNARDADHKGEAGVFESKAIFHHDGFVRAWTPWRRVQGSIAPTAGIALDPTTSRYWGTTKKDATSIDPTPTDLDTVRVTAWGKGYQADPSTDNRLSTAIDKAFGDAGGVFGIFSFGPETPGFKERKPADPVPANRHEQFSMIVATGNGRVALAKSGAFDSTDGVFKPTTAYEDKKNIFTFDATTNPALGKLGIITCAEVSRLPLAAAPNNRLGWLFVGGTGGLAVFTRWFNGKGWNTTLGEGLSDLLPGAQRDDFPGGSGWRFMQILAANGTNPFKDVRKIVSDGSRYLYVMMPDSIYRIDMKAVDQNPGVANPRTPRAYSIFKRTQPVPAPAIPDPTIDYTIILDTPAVIHKVVDTDAQTTLAAVKAAVNAAVAGHGATALGTNPGHEIPIIQAASFNASTAQAVAAIYDVGGKTIADADAAVQALKDTAVFSNTTDKQFLDMIVAYRKNDGNPALAATHLILGTTAGLFYNDITKPFDDQDLTANLKAANWKQLAAASTPPESPIVRTIQGQVMHLEFTSSQPANKMKVALASDKLAQTYADGNLVVTALDPEKKYVATYRFNLTAGNNINPETAWNNPTEVTITPFNEPYHISGDAKKTTPYFYKLGTLNDAERDRIEFDGPFDYFPRTAHIANSVDGFADGVWMLPEPSSFLRDKATGYQEDIDLGLDLTLPLYLGNVQVEAASGAQMVAGEFGVRVND